jgi:hypothetical protein
MTREARRGTVWMTRRRSRGGGMAETLARRGERAETKRMVIESWEKSVVIGIWDRVTDLNEDRRSVPRISPGPVRDN